MSFITQDWNAEESQQLEELGFKLNNRNYYVKKDVILTKRLDGEFNQLFYQVYDGSGLIGNIAANHVTDYFTRFLDIAIDAVSEEVHNFSSLIRIFKEKGYQISIENEESENFNFSATITVNGSSQTFDADDESELELKMLYYIFNDIKNTFVQHV